MKFDEDIPILERGAAFPQFYGNAIPKGDRHCWWNPMDFNNRYWVNFIQWANLEFGKLYEKDCQAEALMMGGEL